MEHKLPVGYKMTGKSGKFGPEPFSFHKAHVYGWALPMLEKEGVIEKCDVPMPEGYEFVTMKTPGCTYSDYRREGFSNMRLIADGLLIRKQFTIPVGYKYVAPGEPHSSRTYQQWREAGFSDDQLKAQGRLVRVFPELGIEWRARQWQDFVTMNGTFGKLAKPYDPDAYFGQEFGRVLRGEPRRPLILDFESSPFKIGGLDYILTSPRRAGKTSAFRDLWNSSTPPPLNCRCVMTPHIHTGAVSNGATTGPDYKWEGSASELIKKIDAAVAPLKGKSRQRDIYEELMYGFATVPIKPPQAVVGIDHAGAAAVRVGNVLQKLVDVDSMEVTVITIDGKKTSVCAVDNLGNSWNLVDVFTPIELGKYQREYLNYLVRVQIAHELTVASAKDKPDINKATMQHLRKGIERLRKQRDELAKVKPNDALRVELKSTHEFANTMRNENNKLRTANEKLMKANAQLVPTNQRLNVQVNNQQYSIDAYKRQVNKLLETEKSNTKQVAEMAQRNVSLTDKVVELESELNTRRQVMQHFGIVL